MSAKTVFILPLAVLLFTGIGCVNPNLQQKVDELTREREDLQRRNSQLDSDLTACKGRCEILERDRRTSRSEPGTALDVPAELKGKVDIRRRGNETVIDIPSDIFFASGSSNLSRDSEKTMGHVVDYIKKNHPQGAVRVEGHTDSDPIKRTKGKYHCNWELGFERAHAVMHNLVDKGGIDPNRVVCESYGEFQPIDKGKKSRNRRVEIVIGQ